MASRSKRVTVGLVALGMACLITTSVPGVVTTARADDKATAFLGGMMAGKFASGMVRRSRMRTAAEMHTAYGQPRAQPVQVQQAPPPAPAAPAAQPSVEAKLDQLNKLAAGGYITPQEYKAKKQAILNSL